MHIRGMTRPIDRRRRPKMDGRIARVPDRGAPRTSNGPSDLIEEPDIVGDVDAAFAVMVEGRYRLVRREP